MSYIERPRFSCMLGGVLATISALPRTIPIIHGAQGCGGSLGQAYSFGGYLGNGYCGGIGSPSTNIGERDIIFGGGGRLESQINNTFDVIDGDLYIVTTTCMTDIIGDDVKGVLSEVGSKDKPILFVDSGGFKGNSYYGYGKLIEELFLQYIPRTEEKRENLVNILGLVPGYDPYFRGDLEEVRRVLNLIGLEVNTFLTNDQTQNNILKAGAASLNIVLSRVYGVEAAKIIKESHDIDYLITDLPIGNIATIEFVHQIAETLGLDKKKVDEILKKETVNYYKYIDRATDVIADTDFQNYAVVIANATQALPYAKYLDNEIGWLPKFIFITDQLSDEQKNDLVEVFKSIDFAQEPQLVFETDTFRIQQYIEQNYPQFKSETYYETISPVFVLASTIDRKLAETLNASFLSISYPVINRIIITRGYAGFIGGLNLLEDLITAQVSGR